MNTDAVMSYEGISTDFSQELERYLSEENAKGPLPRPLDDGRYRQLLRHTFQNEIYQMIASVDSDSTNTVAHTLKNISKYPSYLKIGKQKQRAISTPTLATKKNTPSIKLSDAIALLQSEGPLTCALPADLMASVALFTYIKFFLKVPINLSFTFNHSIDLAQHILHADFSQQPSMCIVSLGPAGSLTGCGGDTTYKPFMITPKTSRSVVAPKTSVGKYSNLANGKYLFMADTPGTSSFYFHELEQNGLIDRNKIGIEDVEPDEAAPRLRDQDPELRAILGFPYYRLNTLFNDCVLIDSSFNSLRSKETILFIDEQRLGTSKIQSALFTVVNTARQRLANSPYAVSLITDMLIEARDYTRFLIRCTGMHDLLDEFIPKDNHHYR